MLINTSGTIIINMDLVIQMLSGIVGKMITVENQGTLEI